MTLVERNSLRFLRGPIDAVGGGGEPVRLVEEGEETIYGGGNAPSQTIGGVKINVAQHNGEYGKDPGFAQIIWNQMEGPRSGIVPLRAGNSCKIGPNDEITVTHLP